MGFIGVSTSSPANCTQASGTVTCDIGTLAVGGQVNVVVNVTAPMTKGSVTNTGTVGFSGTDSQPANNAFGVTVQVK